MDSDGIFQPQNLKFVAREARLASDDAGDTRISRPSQHAKAHDLTGTTLAGTTQSGAQRAWAKSTPQLSATRMGKKHPAAQRNAHGQKSTPSPQRSALRQKMPHISHGTTRPPHAASPQTKTSPQPARPRGGSKAHNCQWLKPTRRRRPSRRPLRWLRRQPRRDPPRPGRTSCRPNP